MADGSIDGKAAVGSLVEQLKLANEQAIALLSSFKEIQNSARSFKTPSQGNAVISQSDQAYTKANAAIKEQNRLLTALERQKAKNARVDGKLSKELAKERFETQRLNRENKERAILQNKQIGAYRKLNLERTKASKTLRDLIASEKASNAEIAKAQSNFDKLDGKIRKADAAVRDSTKNVGNYKSAFQGIKGTIRNLIGAFGLIEGVKFAFNLIKDSVQLAKEARGVEFAFKRLGDAGEDAFERVKASTRGLLSDIDIKSALNEFNNFNISIERADTLFEFLAVTAAQTGKSVEQLQASLVEGLSKKSTQRIDNLGISVETLNEELEKTPVFVDAVANIAERRLKLAGNILDDAANSTEKWNAAWNNLQVSIGKTFSNVGDLDYFAEGLQNSSDLLDAQNAALALGQGLFGTLKAEIRSFTEAGRETNKQLVEEAKRRIEAAEAIKQQTNAYVALNGSLAPLRKGEDAKGGFSFVPPPETPRLLSDINKELERQQEILEAGELSTRSEAKVIQEKIKVLEKERDAILGTEEAKRKKIKSVKDSIGFYTEEISKEKEIQTKLAVTKDAFDASQKKIDEYTEKIRELTGEFVKLNKIDVEILGQDTSNIDFEGITKGYADAFKNAGIEVDLAFTANAIDTPDQDQFQYIGEQAEAAYQRASKAAQASGEYQKDVLQSVLSASQDIYGIDLEGFIQILDKKEAHLEDYADASKDTLLSLNYAILEGTLNRIDQEIEANERKLDLILADENASEKKKLQAEEEYRKRDLELRRKQFKAEQKAAIARTIINTAVAIIQAYAQLGPIGGTIAGVLISALGTVQLATIKSQKPPEFFLGKKATDNFEGVGSVNERPNQREIGVDESGNVTMFPAGKHYRNIKKRDIIIPSMHQFDREIKNPTSELSRRVHKKYGNDAAQRTAMFSVRPEPMDIEPMRKMFAKELAKYSNRPIKNTVIIKTQTKGYRA